MVVFIFIVLCLQDFLKSLLNFGIVLLLLLFFISFVRDVFLLKDLLTILYSFIFDIVGLYIFNKKSNV